MFHDSVWNQKFVIIKVIFRQNIDLNETLLNLKDLMISFLEIICFELQRWCQKCQPWMPSKTDPTLAFED